MVPTFTWTRSMREAPAFTRQHRHGYAAGIHRDLPTGTVRPASELTGPPRAPATHCTPARIRQV